jgi:hypothetical protein
MRLYKLVLTSIASAALVACGGGGAGSSATTIVIPRNLVPYSTPVRVDSIQLTQTDTAFVPIAGIFTKDLSNTGSENVIVAGRAMVTDQINSKISIFGWQGGQLVNQTNTWFSGNDNIIKGTEPDVEFGDFLGNGKIGMYVPPGTDSEWGRSSPGTVFINNGTSFTRVNLNLGAAWAHDSVVYDFDRDGRADIFTLDYGSDNNLALSNGDGTFSMFRTKADGALRGASGVAAADFLGNGTVSLIVTDSSTTLGQQNSLMSWSLSGSDLVMTTQSFLPVGRFDLPKWASYNTGVGLASHNVRALAFDFDNSGLTSAVIFSTPWFTNGAKPAWSEVQFLKNHGGGVFTDVTDNVLVGYNNSMPVSYNPKLIDINGDGLTDIFLSGSTWDNPTVNTQVLLHTADHKFVASYANVFSAFENQAFNAEALRSSAILGGNITNIVRGPNNELYLVTLINTFEGGVSKKAMYLSKIGEQTVTAQATLAAIRTAWPYISEAQANDILSRTSTSWLGLNVINPDKALSPIGNLGLNINGTRTAFNGYISGLKLKDNNTVLFDDVGRSFAVDLSSTSALSSNTWARYSENITDDTRGAQSMKLQYMQSGNFKFGADTATQSLAVGLTGVQIGKNSQLSFQYTQMPFSPFIQMSGSWGLVKKSSMLESTVTTKYQGFVGRAGLMYANTTIDAGLVTDISPITSVWSEVGYEWKHVKLMGGVLPKIVSGTASLRLPVGVDMSGVSLYNDSKVNISNPTTSYVRLAYQEQVSKTVSFSFNGLVSDRKQTSLMAEMKIKF